MGKASRGKQMKRSGKTPNVSDLLSQAQIFLDTFEYEQALQIALQALAMQPESLTILELCGFIYQEMEMSTEAKYCLEKAVALSPECGHVKYLYLAQMCQGAEAIQYFLKGIQLMEGSLAALATIATSSSLVNNGTDSTTKKGYFDENITPSKICSAYCSIAEIYMTDLKESEDFLVNCKSAIDKALSIEPQNPEALITFASYLMMKEEKTVAKIALQTSMDIWLPKLHAAFVEEKGTDGNIAEDVDMGENKGDIEEVAGISLDACLHCARMLMSLDENEKALDILEILTDQEDENLEIAYVAAMAANSLDKNNDENLARCRDLLKDAMKLAKRYNEKEIFGELKNLLSSCPAPKLNAQVKENEDSDESEMEMESA